MRKVLWIGDAGVASGFARCTHWALERIGPTWDATVLGINYHGDPPQEDGPGVVRDAPGTPRRWAYPMYPAFSGGDAFGLGRLANLGRALAPDLIVVQSDTWNVPAYLETLAAANLAHIPVLGVVAVDGGNCKGAMLNGLATAVFWTDWAEREAREGGYLGPAAVVPLGVDRSVFHVGPQRTAREQIKFVDRESGDASLADAFIVLDVNRNQRRKRIDLVVRAFCRFLDLTEARDAWLVIHSCPTGDDEIDVGQLAEYYGHADRVAWVRHRTIGRGLPDAALALEYQAADVFFTASQGEGFGLGALEAMACGCACLLPDNAAYADWAKGAAWLLPCPHPAVNLGNGANSVGSVIDESAAVRALDQLYRDRSLRRQYADAGRQRAAEPRFDWTAWGDGVCAAMDAIVPAPAAVDPLTLTRGAA